MPPWHLWQDGQNLKLRKGQRDLGNLWKLAWPGGSSCHVLKGLRGVGPVMLGVSDLATSTGPWVTWVEARVADHSCLLKPLSESVETQKACSTTRPWMG